MTDASTGGGADRTGSGRAGAPDRPDGADGNAGDDGAAGPAESDERLLLFLVVPEVLALAVLCVLLALGLLGRGGFLASYPRPIRLAALAATAVQCLIVVWVYLDVRRTPEMGPMWVHAAAMPVLNVFGLAAYLAERSRKRGE